MTPTSIERPLRHIITYSTHQLGLQSKILELLHKIKKGRSTYGHGAASYQGQCQLIRMDPGASFPMTRPGVSYSADGRNEPYGHVL